MYVCVGVFVYVCVYVGVCGGEGCVIVPISHL